MKKLFLVGALALTGMFASAQEGLQGKWFVTGEVGYTHDKEKTKLGDVKTDKFSVMPTVGYFITKDIAVGAGVGFEHSKTGDDKTNKFVIAPMARKYWGIGEKVFIFGEASVPVGIYNEKSKGTKSDDTTTWGIWVKPGLDVFLTPNWTIETKLGGIGYQDNDSSDSFSLGLKLDQVSVGVKYIF